MQIIYYNLLGILIFPFICSSYILFPNFNKPTKSSELSSSLNGNGGSEDLLFQKTIQKRNFNNINSNDDNGEPSPGLVIRLTEKLSNLLTSEKSMELLMKQFHGFVTPDFKFKALQMNVNIMKTTLHKLDKPKINFKVQSPHSLAIKTSGGFAQFRGIYKGTYRTVRDGQIYIDVSGLNLFFKLDLIRSTNEKNELISKVSSCDFSVDEIFIEMKRPLFTQANEIFKQIFLDYLSKEICQNFIEKYITEKIGNKFHEALNNSPISLKDLETNDEFDSSLIREPIFDENSLFFALNGKFGVDEKKDGGENERSRVEMYESDNDHMIYTYISDFVFNEFLKNSKNKEFKIEKSFTKMEKLLKFNCDQNCIGCYLPQSLIDSNEDVSIKIKFSEAPKVEFLDYGAKLFLNFNAELKTQTTKTSIISANFKINSLIERFEIKALLDENNGGDDYKLNAKVSINNIEISDVKSDLSEAAELINILPEAIKNNKEIFEELIESNLHSLFPIDTNSYLRVSYIHGFFRSRTLIFAYDLASDGHLIRHMQLP